MLVTSLLEIILGIAQNRGLWITFITILGAILGSYIGSITYRVPQRLLGNNTPLSTSLADQFYSNHSSRKPNKHSFIWFSICTKCYSNIPFYYNLPILSWIYLKGHCASCKQKISLRYLLIELTTTIAFFLTAFFYSNSLQSILFLIFVLFSIALFWTDFEYYLLPNSFTIGLLSTGLIINFEDKLVDFSDAALGVILGYFSLWLVNFVYRNLRHHDGMGNGDFKYLAAIGAWFGWYALPYIVFFASFLAISFCLILIIQRYIKNKHIVKRFASNKVGGYSLQTKIPFGVFLSLASSGYYIVVIL